MKTAILKFSKREKNTWLMVKVTKFVSLWRLPTVTVVLYSVVGEAAEGDEDVFSNSDISFL